MIDHLFRTMPVATHRLSDPQKRLVDLGGTQLEYIVENDVRTDLCFTPIETNKGELYSGFINPQTNTFEFTRALYALHLKGNPVLCYLTENEAGPALFSAPYGFPDVKDNPRLTVVHLYLRENICPIRIQPNQNGKPKRVVTYQSFTPDFPYDDLPFHLLYRRNRQLFLRELLFDGKSIMMADNEALQVSPLIESKLQDYGASLSTDSRQSVAIIEKKPPAPAAAPAVITDLKTTPKPATPRKTAREIKAYLDLHIMGQEQVKKDLAVIAENYLAGRCSHAMLIGPSGTGKTESAKVLSQFLGTDTLHLHFPDYTKAGYVGKDIHVPFLQLAVKNNSTDLRAVVFIDEFDKGDARDYVGSEGVIDQILPMLEGRPFQPDIPLQGKKSNGEVPPLIEIKTSNLLFLFAGAFSDKSSAQSLENIVKQRLGTDRNAIGFANGEKTAEQKPTRVLPTDLGKYGIKPEFVGRVPNILQFYPLTRDELRFILSKKIGNPLDDYRGLFAGLGYDLAIDDGVVELILDNLPPGTGARSLNDTCQRIFKNLQFDAPDFAKGDRIHLTTELARQLLVL